MRNEVFENMLSRYDLTTEQHKRNLSWLATFQRGHGLLVACAG